VKHSYRVAPIVLALLLSSFVESRGQAVSPPAGGHTPIVAPVTASLSVEQAVDEALQSNTEIRAAARRLSLARLKTTTAGSLEDPVLMVRDWQTPLEKPWDLDQAQLMFSLQRTFVSKDKRALRSKVAGDDVEVASDELESLRQEVAASVRETCAVLLRNADEMRLHNQQSAVLNEALSAALAEYTTGKVPQADVLRAQMALTRLGEHLVELEQEHDTALAQLNALMGRSPDETVEIAGTYRVPPAAPPLEELKRIAIEHRPELNALRKQIAKSGDESQLARMATKPDFTVAAGYMLMPTGSNFRNAYMAELTMNLPRLNRARHDGEAKQADTATDVAQAELDARTSSVFLEIRQAQIEVASAQKRVKLYRDTLLPQAEAAFKATAGAYQNNRGEFMNLIDSQNLLLDIRTDYFKALSAADAGSAQLERAIGAPLPTGNTTTSMEERTGK
jgi:outer membrane protein, heavy metal efflux system